MPETTDNVVNYTVIVQADNSEGMLLPGMTADVEFIRQKKENVLAVPSAALRFQPPGLSAADIAKAIHLAGLGDLSLDERRDAEARYDERSRDANARKEANAETKPPGLAGMLMRGPGPGGGMGPVAGGPPGGPRARASVGVALPAESASQRKPLWYFDDAGALAVVLVEPGASNATMTELTDAEGLEGREVIVKMRTE